MSGQSDNGTASSLLEQLRRIFEEANPIDMEEANLIASGFMGAYNSAPQEDLGGLSPEQVYSLTRPDWLGRSVQMNDDLTHEEASKSELVHNAAVLLHAVMILGSVKATTTGAFNRKFANQMLDEMLFPEGVRESVRRVCKVVNQRDVPHLELLRHLLPAAGLLLFRKGEFRLTRKAKDLLNANRAGELYALLFQTYVTRINFAAGDWLPDAPGVQHCFGFSLYQIHRCANEWVEIADIARSLFLPAVIDQLPALSFAESDATYARNRIVRPLEQFALISVEREDPYKTVARIRKSPLFDRFLRFELRPIG